MPLELVVPGRGAVELREYDEPPPNEGEVRVRSTFPATEHGALFRRYRGDENDWTTAFEREHRISRPEPALPDSPRHVGNTTVGVVTDVGPGVKAFDEGDRVYGHLPVRETRTVPETDLVQAPDGMAPEAIVFTTPAGVGVHLVRGGKVQLGDATAVFGAGAIGRMAAQLARIGGARPVIVSEPIERWRAAARGHGADPVADPTEGDAAMRIKREVTAGEEPGVDRALEASAASAGLDDAVRAAASEGTVASCGYYEGDAALGLDAEFHRNAVEILSVQPGSSGVLSDHPRWSYDTLHEEAFGHLRAGRLDVDGLLDPVVPPGEAAAALERIEADPEEGIRLGVVYE